MLAKTLKQFTLILSIIRICIVFLNKKSVHGFSNNAANWLTLQPIRKAQTKGDNKKSATSEPSLNRIKNLS